MLEMPTITTWYRCPRGHVLPFSFGFVQRERANKYARGTSAPSAFFEAMRAAFPTDPCPKPENK